MGWDCHYAYDFLCKTSNVDKITRPPPQKKNNETKQNKKTKNQKIKQKTQSKTLELGYCFIQLNVIQNTMTYKYRLYQ